MSRGVHCIKSVVCSHICTNILIQSNGLKMKDICPINWTFSYYILLEDIFSNFYIAGEVFMEINSGKAEIMDIDNSLYGMLVEY